MLIDRTHRTWFFLSVIILAVASIGYVFYAQSTPKGASGGSLIGLGYGVIGTAMMIFAGLLAARKKVSFWRLGSAKFWLKGHLWLGTLSFPMIMFHAGFELGGTLEKVLWGFFAVVILSGFFGLILQNILPRLLNSRVPLETMRAQIPYVRKRNRVISDRLVSVSCGAIPLDNDPMVHELTGLTKHGVEINDIEAEADALKKTAKTKEEKDAAKALKDKAKAAKTQWVERIVKGEEGLYLDLAAFSKSEWGGQTADDFTSMLPSIYTIKGVNDQPKAQPVAAAPAAPKKKAAKKAGGSPFDQLKPKAAAGESKPSALEQAKAAGAKKPAKAKPGGNPLEMARKAGAAGKKPDTAAASNLSPLEQARLAGPKGGQSKAAMSAAAPAGSAPVKQVGPAPKKGKGIKKPQPTPAEVSDIDAELAAIQKLLTEKYKYESGDAQTYAESTRTFLKTDPAALKLKAESEVKSISSLLADKYGYSPELATEIAEIARPFLDGTAEEQAAAKKAAAEAARAKPKAAAPTPVAETPSSDKPLSPLEAARQAGPFGGGGGAAPAPTSEKPLSPLEAARQAGAAGAAKKKPASPLEAARQAGAAGGAKKKPASPLEAARQAGAAGGAKKKPASPLDAARQAGAAGGAKKKPASPLDAARQAGAAGGAKKKPASPLEAARQAGSAGGAKKKAASPFDQKPKGDAAKKKAAPKKVAVKKPPVPKKKAAKKKSPVLRTEELRAFYLDHVRPYLQSDGKKGRLADKTEANRAFTAMRATLPVELHSTLSSLRDRCDENRQFALQQRIHNWLHYWLALHIPFSIALYVLAAVHIVVALRVIPWQFPKLW